MRITRHKLSYAILLGYFVILCCTSYILLRNTFIRQRFEEEKFRQISELADDDIDWNPWGEEFENEHEQNIISHHEPPKILWNLEEKEKEVKTVLKPWNSSIGVVNVEVWGKAAIGLYLWEHILQAGIEERMGGVWSYGAKTINNIRFTFRTGPGVMPDKVPKDTKNLLLILNSFKITFSKMWLDSLASLPQLLNTGVVLLGSETCNNSWIYPYLYKNGGPVKFLFTTYDSPEIDDVTFYQWPLGVATYRGFPSVDSATIPVHKYRKFSCNFLGTIYPNSTREKLMKIVQDPLAEDCYTLARNGWKPLESDESRELYVKTLSQSDLTLNPVGKNTECYRIYEAIAYGSVPVVEDIMTPGDCGKAPASDLYPLRLLKESKAPLIYIKDWSQITKILEKEKRMRHSDKVKRRRQLLLWYETFKSKMREKLVKTVYKSFFNIERM